MPVAIMIIAFALGAAVEVFLHRTGRARAARLTLGVIVIAAGLGAIGAGLMGRSEQRDFMEFMTAAGGPFVLGMLLGFVLGRART